LTAGSKLFRDGNKFFRDGSKLLTAGNKLFIAGNELLTAGSEVFIAGNKIVNGQQVMGNEQCREGGAGGLRGKYPRIFLLRGGYGCFAGTAAGMARRGDAARAVKRRAGGFAARRGSFARLAGVCLGCMSQ
jgi:hypothetical protein